MHRLAHQPKLFSFQHNFDQISDGVVSEIKLLFKTKRADVEIEDLIVYSQTLLFYRNSIYVPAEVYHQKFDALLVLAGVRI